MDLTEDTTPENEEVKATASAKPSSKKTTAAKASPKTKAETPAKKTKAPAKANAGKQPASPKSEKAEPNGKKETETKTVEELVQRKGTLVYFNPDTGNGVIREPKSGQSFWCPKEGVEDKVKTGDEVSFCTPKGAQKANAMQVKLVTG